MSCTGCGTIKLWDMAGSQTDPVSTLTHSKNKVGVLSAAHSNKLISGTPECFVDELDDKKYNLSSSQKIQTGC